MITHTPHRQDRNFIRHTKLKKTNQIIDTDIFCLLYMIALFIIECVLYIFISIFLQNSDIVTMIATDYSSTC